MRLALHKKEAIWFRVQIGYHLRMEDISHDSEEQV